MKEKASMNTLQLDRITQTAFGPVLWIADIYTNMDIVCMDREQARQLARQLQIFAATGQMPAEEEKENDN
jgi:hypothetical protein